MDLRCPKCNSTDLTKIPLVYQEGLSRMNTGSRLRAIAVGSSGPDVMMGRAITKGIQQTETSKLLAPPKKWSCLKLLGWSVLVFISVGWIAFYVNTVMANSSTFVSLPLAAYAVLAFCAFAGMSAGFWRHNHSTYPREVIAFESGSPATTLAPGTPTNYVAR